MEFFAQISGWIVFPIIMALFLGRWLDDKYDRSPMFLLICVGVAFVITNVGLLLMTLKAAKRIEKEAKESKKQSNSRNTD